MGLLSTIGGVAGSFFGGPAGGAIGSALGGAIEGDSGTASSAASAANTAAQADIDLRRRMYEEDVARRQPFYQAGVNALPSYVSGIQAGGELVRGFTPSDFTTDPGYAFRLSEGQKALDRSAAARGGLISGGALKAAARYGQEMGSQEFTNAFNRYQTERQARLGPLQSLAGVGQTTATNLGQAGASNAANVGNLITGGAAANAAGQVGAANALTSGLGTYLNYSQGNNLLDALQRNQSMQPVNTGGYTNVPSYMVR